MLDWHHSQNIQIHAIATEQERARPFMILRPKIYPDGNQWCTLYGDDLMEGVAGFGDTPEKAALDFDKNWYGQTLKARQSEGCGDE